MTKRILDVGNCAPDFASISRFLTSNFDCELTQAHSSEEALSLLSASEYDLVLVNRKLDLDYSDGIDIIKSIQADPNLSSVPVMLITNYAEHQDAAVALGAQRGFGKLEHNSQTAEQLKPILG